VAAVTQETISHREAKCVADEISGAGDATLA
jgi:hypothetical protein